MFRRFLAGVGIPALLIALLLVTVALVRPSESASRKPVAKPEPVLRQVSGDFLYVFHLPTGTEAVFDRVRDPDLLRNLAPERADLARRLRRELERRLGVRSLDDLRGSYADLTERLKGLGYL